MVKKIAVYGSYLVKVPVRQRFWRRRKDGVTQRYWRKTRRLRTVRSSGRYEFYGKGKDLYRAVALARRFTPRGFVTVSAADFLRHLEQYGFEGRWIESKVGY